MSDFYQIKHVCISHMGARTQGQMGSADRTPRKMDEKLKSENTLTLTPAQLRLRGLGEAQLLKPEARPPNAFGLSKTRLVTTSLVLLCDRVICSISVT